MPSETHNETRSPESSLEITEKKFNDSLAQYVKNPKSQTFQALREAQSRLKAERLAAGQPISDLLPKVQQALSHPRPRK
jgi:hypothetical protein